MHQKEIKCIVCSHKATDEYEMTWHYEELKNLKQKCPAVNWNPTEIVQGVGTSGKKSFKFSHKENTNEHWETVQSRQPRQDRQHPQNPQLCQQVRQKGRENRQQPRQETRHNEPRRHREPRQEIRQDTRPSRGRIRSQSGSSYQLRPCKFGDRFNKSRECRFPALPLYFLQQSVRRN